MITFSQFKGYFWYVFGLLGVVFFWAGTWDGVGNIGYLKKPWASLIVGLVMLTISGFIFKEGGVFGEKLKTAASVLREVGRHPHTEEFHVKYLDKIKGKNIFYKVDKLKNIEKEFLVFLEGNKEIFVPVHRVTEVLHKGKSHWRA